eukprot:CAMPEP_0178477568 /NCGR_PEP_ID=MMETSP0696-20121128/4198_1 /TAXON_ID=265572 /ORGANISM="Extubocellulus spinifer, Strain CCMP396" /LENGTH=579 /DNA_ID=CAMNT_0020104883 /DNA_START=150 /DNA_END=1889 /DNA_ORIENTATION=+
MDPTELQRHLTTALSLPRNHVTVGLSNLLSSNKQTQSLLIHRRLPDNGWSDLQIHRLLLVLGELDTSSGEVVAAVVGGVGSGSGSSGSTEGSRSSGSSGVGSTGSGAGNAYPGRWCGVGEREGRTYSTLILTNHYGLTHGIGRSGDVTESQPKALGSSALYRLTTHLVLDAVRRGAGLDGSKVAGFGVVLPLCTGMSVALVLAALRDGLPSSSSSSSSGQQGQRGTEQRRDVVLWSRIDQKSCYKAVLSAGLTCIVIPTTICNGSDEVTTDLDAMEQSLDKYRGRVLAVISTTSCFAPRVPDRVDEIAKLCAREENRGVAHVINHAYGLQCGTTCKLINRACVVGRVDAIICSTDKNFLVPVGGALVLSPSEDVINNVGKVYPGRASAAPIIDLFVTLLSMGLNGYRALLEERMRLVTLFKTKFEAVAAKYGERPLVCPRNTISFGITLDTLGGGSETSYFGSMLFTRCVSGTRVVPTGQTKMMGGKEFLGFGSSTEGYPHSYLTAACAIGLGEDEMEEFFRRLDKAFKDFFAKQKKKKERAEKEKKGEDAAAALTEEDTSTQEDALEGLSDKVADINV